MLTLIQKEIRFGTRGFRFLILTAGFLFFAMLNPVMNKFILPGLMRSQMPGITDEALEQMMATSQLAVMQGYLGDVFEVGTVLVVFTLCGLIAQEIRDGLLILPLCAGRGFGKMLAAKMVVFGLALFLIPGVALLVDYLYAGALYAFDVSVGAVLVSGLLQGGYMVFVLALILGWGALLGKPIPTGFATLASIYGVHFIGSLFSVSSHLPTGLLSAAAALNGVRVDGLSLAVAGTAGAVLFLVLVALLQLRHKEWNRRPRA